MLIFKPSRKKLGFQYKLALEGWSPPGYHILRPHLIRFRSVAIDIALSSG
jgi:hypothetical protein